MPEASPMPTLHLTRRDQPGSISLIAQDPTYYVITLLLPRILLRTYYVITLLLPYPLFLL